MSVKAVDKEIILIDEIDVLAKYTYVLAIKNQVRGRVYDEKGNPRPDPEYPSRRNVLLRSSIVWPADPTSEENPRQGMKDPWSGKVRKPGRHLIRYYDGCTTLFVDDQPREKDTLDQLINSTRELFFIDGYLAIQGYDTMLKTYLDWSSWNEGSKFRVGAVQPIFKLLDAEKERKIESEELDEMELAMKRAKEAKDDHMIIHSKFLDVASVDYKTGNTLSNTALRTEYRKAAKADPALFNRTYNDKSMHVTYWIDTALKSGQITTNKIPNRAVWAQKGVVICDISGLQSSEAILNKLIEFAQQPEGAEFKKHLEALNK